MEMLSIGKSPFFCGYLLLLICMLVIPVNSSTFCPACCDCGDVTPIDPYILTGQQLLLYCHLYDQTIQNYKVNSSHVQFQKVNTLIPQNNVKILNESTAVLNITINELSDKGTYYCLFKSEKQALFDTQFIVGRQVVKVEYYPQKIPVESVHCVVYDWDYNLTCYWKKPDVKYAVESDIETIVYWSKYCGKKLNMCDKADIEKNQCYVNGSLDVGIWCLLLLVNNTKTSTSVITRYVFKDGENVKPSPVSLFQSQVLNSTCVKLNWKHLRIHRDKFYEISYISKWDNEMKVLNTSTTATAENICNLIPYTKYNFSIGVYPNEKSGYRSELVLTTAQTKQYIPDVPPEVTEGSYINNLDHCTSVSKHRNVTLYWKAIPERYMNGKLTGYKLEYYENGQVKSRIIQPQKTSEEIQVDCDYFYILKIKAKTVVGYTKEAATIKVLGFEQQDIKPPKVIPVLEVKSNITGNLKASVNVSWSSAKLVHEVKGYTVYWCQYTSKFICNSEISWRRVSGNMSSLKIPFDNYMGTYLFGVSIETNVGSSGFVWESCVYKKDADPVPPKVVFGQSPPNKGLTVTWSADYCNNDSPYIIGFKVRHCEANKDRTCKGGVSESKLISTDAMPRYDIYDLDSTKTYGVSVRSVSWNRESPDSELLIGQPHDSDLTPGTIAGIAIAGVFVSCFAVAGLVFCCRVCKKKSAEIRKPYEIAVPIIKTSQLNGNGNLIGYTNISEPSSPVESHQLLNGFVNGGIHANGGIQKQISRDSGHESIASEIQNSPSPDQVVSKLNEPLVPVKEESDVSNNSIGLNSKGTEESSLSGRPSPDKYYSQVAFLMSESEDSSLRPSSDVTNEGRQNPAFVNSNSPGERVFTVAHVTSVQLDNENPFYPNPKKSLPHVQPATTQIENQQNSFQKDASVLPPSVSPYVKADLDSESTVSFPCISANSDGNVLNFPCTSVSAYVKGDLCLESNSVSPYIKGDMCSGNPSVSPYVKGDICSENLSVSPYVKDDVSVESTTVSSNVKGDLCSGCTDSVSPCMSADFIKGIDCLQSCSAQGSENPKLNSVQEARNQQLDLAQGTDNPQLDSVQKNNDTSEDVSKDTSEYQMANYEDFVNPLFDKDLYELDKDSVEDYVMNAGIETSADGKDAVGNYVMNAGIETSADGKDAVGNYVMNAGIETSADGKDSVEDYVINTEIETSADGKDSVGSYVITAEIETSADGKDPVNDYVRNAGIETLADGSSICDYVTNDEIRASKNVSDIEGNVPLISEHWSSLLSAGDEPNLDVSQGDSEEAQNKIIDAISEMSDVDSSADVHKTDETDSPDTYSDLDLKISSEDESTTSSTGPLILNPTKKNACSNSVTNDYIYSHDLDSNIIKENINNKDSFDNSDSETAFQNSLSTLDKGQNGYVVDLSETAVLENKDSCLVSYSPPSLENKDSCSNSPVCSPSLTTPFNNSGYMSHDLISGKAEPSRDHKIKTHLERNGYISECRLKDTQGSGED